MQTVIVLVFLTCLPWKVLAHHTTRAEFPPDLKLLNHIHKPKEIILQNVHSSHLLEQYVALIFITQLPLSN